jgi:hypothetical protein
MVTPTVPAVNPTALTHADVRELRTTTSVKQANELLADGSWTLIGVFSISSLMDMNNEEVSQPGKDQKSGRVTGGQKFVKRGVGFVLGRVR